MQGATAKCSRVNFKARPNTQTFFSYPLHGKQYKNYYVNSGQEYVVHFKTSMFNSGKNGYVVHSASQNSFTEGCIM